MSGAILSSRKEDGVASHSARQGGYVEVRQIIAELDKELAALRAARALLAGESSGPQRRGRTPVKSGASSATGKSRLSPEGRRRISEALKRRWARQRKAAAKAAK